ncbi:MAG TPA: hypothetical protein VLD84_07385 [Nitrososphaeraceae archaeon]|nr:hypothetical protein [Nitrososphaeraceae archaeon]
MQNIQKFNFVTAGDFGCGDETNRTIEGMIKKDPEIVIALCDLSYGKSASCWLNSIIPLDTSGRIKITFGDHDLTRKMVKFNDYLSGTEYSGQEVLPDTYHHLFDMYGVDIVLQAHSHNYQRTFPLINTENHSRLSIIQQ